MNSKNILILSLLISFVLLIAGCTYNLKITPGSPSETVPETELSGCDAFPNKLDACEPFSCEFEHPLTGELMEKGIIGLVNGKCKYTEEMPNNGKMNCEYTESLRKAVAQYHRDLLLAESTGTGVKADSGGDVEVTYTIDGKEVANPFEEAMTNGQCTISEYGIQDDIQDIQDKCPPGQVYKGESYTYENGEQIAHTICSNPNQVCPTCENCVSGTSKKIISGAKEICSECMFDKDCKEGHHCFDNSCLNNNVIINNPTCAGFDGFVPNDPCKEYSCEKCEEGHLVCQSGWNSWPSVLRYRCIECDDSFKECAEGYKCEEYKCVSEQGVVEQEVVEQEEEVVVEQEVEQEEIEEEVVEQEVVEQEVVEQEEEEVAGLACGVEVLHEDEFRLGNVMFQYRSADNMLNPSPRSKFKNIEGGYNLVVSTEVVTVFRHRHNGVSYWFKSASDFEQDDYDIELISPCGGDLGCGPEISRDEYFTLGGTRFQYKGGDRTTKTSPKVTIKDDEAVEYLEFSPKLIALTSLPYDGEVYLFESVSDYNQDDFSISLFSPCE
jgi:hypothetical protein